MAQMLAAVVVSVGLVAGCAAPGAGDAQKEAAAAPAASSRMTVGDLKAKGGKRITAAEMKELHTGATIRGSNQFGNWTRKQGADGKYSGQNAQYMGGTRSFNGDWRIDEEGRNCSLNRAQFGAMEACSFYYSLDGKYYTVSGENPSDSAVLEDRLISR